MSHWKLALAPDPKAQLSVDRARFNAENVWTAQINDLGEAAGGFLGRNLLPGCIQRHSQASVLAKNQANSSPRRVPPLSGHVEGARASSQAPLGH